MKKAIKKAFAVLATVSATCCVGTLFAACGSNGEHQHEYGSEWKHNETHHWHECKDDCNEKEKDKAKHSDGTNGVYDDVCDVCGAPMKHEHRLTEVPAEKATCTTEGHSAYWECKGCEAWFVDKDAQQEITDKTSVAIDKIAHHIIEVPAQTATCAQQGNIAHYKCDACGELYSDSEGKNPIADKNSVYLDKTKHNMVHHVAVSVTCQRDGNIEYYECLTCKNFYEDQKGETLITDKASVTIKSNGTQHDWNEWETVTEATCTNKGKEKRTCKTNSTHTESRNTDMIAHSVTQVPQVNATCTTDGMGAYYKCGVCQANFSDAEGKTPISDLNSLVITSSGHDYQDGKCTACGLKEATEGLTYYVDKSSGTAAVVGMGTATDTDIVIPEKYNNYPVTEISAKAFRGHTELTSVVINDSMRYINDYAFYGCDGLISVTLGSGLSSISSHAFENCNRLIEVFDKSTLGVTADSTSNGYVGKYAQNVYTTTAGESKLVIGDNGFAVYDKTTVVKYFGTDREVSIPDGITTIHNYAFKESNIKSVILPNTVTSIGNYSFNNCGNLESVTVGTGLKSIGKYAFADCFGLTTMNIPDGVTSIGEYAFDECYSLTGINMPDELTALGNYAFNFCRSWVGSLTIPSGISVISSGAFYGCAGLTEVILPEGVTQVNQSAFSSCDGLTNITIPASMTSMAAQSFGCGRLIEVFNKSKLNIITGVPAYGDTTHDNSGVGYRAKNIYTPTSGASKLTTDANGFVIYDGNTLVAYRGTETDVVIPEGITTINRFAFDDAFGMTSVTLPASLTSIGDYAFNFCFQLAEVYNKSTTLTLSAGATNNGYVAAYAKAVYNEASTQSKVTTDANGFIIYDGTVLIGYKGTAKDITIPAGITEIAANAFRQNATVVSVIIPDSVLTIGKEAFRNCFSLTTVAIGNGVQSLPNNAFGWCPNLTTVTIGSGVTSIDNTAFSSCSKLESITVAENNQNYASQSGVLYNKAKTEIVLAPYGLKGTIILSETLTTIKERTFAGRKNISVIIVPKSLKTIGEYAFSDCGALSTVLLCEGANWSNISVKSYNDSITYAQRYTFSATTPAYNGRYWHYAADGVTPVIW